MKCNTTKIVATLQSNGKSINGLTKKELQQLVSDASVNRLRKTCLPYLYQLEWNVNDQVQLSAQERSILLKHLDINKRWGWRQCSTTETHVNFENRLNDLLNTDKFSANLRYYAP